MACPQRRRRRRRRLAAPQWIIVAGESAAAAVAYSEESLLQGPEIFFWSLSASPAERQRRETLVEPTAVRVYSFLCEGGTTRRLFYFFVLRFDITRVEQDMALSTFYFVPYPTS